MESGMVTPDRFSSASTAFLSHWERDVSPRARSMISKSSCLAQKPSSC